MPRDRTAAGDDTRAKPGVYGHGRGGVSDHVPPSASVLGGTHWAAAQGSAPNRSGPRQSVAFGATPRQYAAGTSVRSCAGSEGSASVSRDARASAIIDLPRGGASSSDVAAVGEGEKSWAAHRIFLPFLVGWCIQ